MEKARIVTKGRIGELTTVKLVNRDGKVIFEDSYIISSETMGQYETAHNALKEFCRKNKIQVVSRLSR